MHDPRERVVVDVRPWGRFERLTHNEPSTVKIITVNAGGALSLQRHEKRHEFWTVLSGEATVEIDGVTHHGSAGQKFFIPVGSTHRLSAGDGPVTLLEVAFGDFDEADIERLEDVYDRA